MKASKLFDVFFPTLSRFPFYWDKNQRRVHTQKKNWIYFEERVVQAIAVNSHPKKTDKEGIMKCYCNDAASHYIADLFDSSEKYEIGQKHIAKHVNLNLGRYSWSRFARKKFFFCKKNAYVWLWNLYQLYEFNLRHMKFISAVILVSFHWQAS